jgi:hypothetical protein
MNRLKLNKLNAEQLTKVNGGKTYLYCNDNFPHLSCGCGCYYQNDGGSSTKANFSANVAQGIIPKVRDGYDVEHYCPSNA